MLQCYLKAAVLHSWLSRPQCPPAIQKCKILLNCAYSNTDVDNCDVADNSINTTMSVPVPQDLSKLVRERTVALCAHLKHNRIVYS